MPTMTVHFDRCTQDSQDYGSDDQHMVSRVFLRIDCEGRRYTGLHADVKQAVGSDFETEPLEISGPHDYVGSLNYRAFREAVEDYYTSLVGSSGSGIRIAGGGNIRMRDNTFIMPRSYAIPVADD